MTARDERCWIIKGDDLEMVPGFYTTKFVKDGPDVPVCLKEEVERDEETGAAMGDAVYTLIVNGEVVRDPLRRYPRGLIGKPTTEADYLYRLALKNHAERHDPDHPAANPHAPIDLMRAPVPF